MTNQRDRAMVARSLRYSALANSEKTMTKKTTPAAACAANALNTGSLKGRWLDGTVATNGVRYLVGPDGSVYRIKKIHRQYLKPGMKVYYVPSKSLGCTATRCVPVGMLARQVQLPS